MDIPDTVLGRAVLVTSVTLYLTFVSWVSCHPFIDHDLWIYQYIPDPKWALLSCAVWGLFFIGGLMTFTVYHLRPYL